MALDLLVLDWSGPISYDFPLVHASVNKIMEHFRLPPVSEEELRTDFRPNAFDFYASRGIKDPETVKRMHLEYFKKSAKPTPVPGAPEAIRELSEHVPVAVFSAHPEEELLGDIFRYGLHNHISYAVGSVNKASSRDFEFLLNMAHTDRKNVFYAGDTIIDLALMHREGIRGVAVVQLPYSYQDVPQIKAFQPQPSHGIVTHVRELLPIVKNGL